MIDVLKTTRTFKTRDNAERHLKKSLAKLGLTDVRFCIAVNDEGRFAPIVFNDSTRWNLGLIHEGVTVVG
jgi:hypothetical protein